MKESLEAFLIAGIALGALYDIIRLFRLVFAKKAAVFLLDFLFFLIASPVIFILLLSYNNGSVRVIYFTAAVLGFLIYILTVYRVTAVPERFIASGLRKIFKYCLKSLKKVLQNIKKLYYNIFTLSRKALQSKKKSKNIRKKKIKEKSGESNEEFLFESEKE